MLEQLQCINHLNEKIEFGCNGIFANYNDLRDFSWKTEVLNDRISSFSKGVVSKKLPITIQAKTEQEGIAKRNALFEIMEKDVLAGEHGRFIIGDYYMKCFVTGSTKSAYLISKRHLIITLHISTDYPQWVKEHHNSFNPLNPQPPTGKRNFDFNFNFKIDFTSPFKKQILNNTSFTATDFIMQIFGPIINPTIHIGGHAYKVNTTVEITDVLTINTKEKTIVSTKSNGNVENKFHTRDKEFYIFEKIKAGENSVSWDNTFGFNITLLDERSEPKWI